MKRVLYSVVAAALFVSLATAQFGGPPGPPPPRGPHGRGFGPGGFGPGMHPGRPVTGAPYSATATDTFTQTLANGNTIQRTITATVARDSSGRTYEQRTVSGGPFASNNGPTTITFIDDPVGGYSYVLNATTKVATRRAIHAPQGGNGPLAEGTPRVPRPANPNVTETDLGTNLVNGVNAQGKRSVHTIPAGTIGNAQAITSTNETWFSPDLHVVVSATRNDPRTGTTVYALTNIQRTEPAATLFQVPSDYTIQDARGFNRQGRGPRPHQ
ncbi:MAG TPA: hypothetical protein VFA65_21175 [Bryobacteraceae bacterium]|nr:hypothetical protein [Bryobacteraceae bacterium]